MDDLPPFTATPIKDIEGIHERLVDKFNTHTTRPLDYRLRQLRSLYWGLKDSESALLEACKLDLNKSAYETYMTEVGWVLNDIIFMQKNLPRFAKDEKAEDMDLINSFMSPRIRKDPLGCCLIIGAYNFPLQLSLGPLVGAISAGCTAVLKPSESASNAARIMQKVIEESLDPDAYVVVQGAVPETTALLNCKWDKIFYTGGEAVGKIIAKKAAETLTPVTLELGGRNPAIITKHADARLAARRLLWAKLLNAGQVCVSQNYILVDREILPSFLHHLKLALKDFQPDGAAADQNYAHIINRRSFDRLTKLLASTNGKILLGGSSDVETLFFEPTVIQLDSASDPILQEESFGPLIPILPVTDLDEAIRISNSIHATPLGLYPFGNTSEITKILSSTRSGGASINDAYFHASIPTLSFGGVGDSGSGAYRGRASFECFSHRRSITKTPGWIEMMLDVRYPPFREEKLGQLKSMTALKPDFDRNGKAVQGWLGWVLGLGSKSVGGAVLRWAVLGAVVAALRVMRERGSI